ncbi:hypothetical protein ABL78_3949 [Leptomonas seymouri]|uniref:Uncharacterized protein n=1 Tax=Leptomonas seymouri TaxID=5684 RepID=A0A0N1I734_LEPSE|nr:hypothetical protein ABL78_3949 [Leptomonas seymouri]|eukprot:KPI86958.1 hypothetical protein ABL78_3949 [Leptomonas seymouri]
MFPGGYLPDYGRQRVRRAQVEGSRFSSPRLASPAPGNSAHLPSAKGSGDASALSHFLEAEYDGPIYVPEKRADTEFALPPSFITCLVRHIDHQHNVLATPAIVERCLRDLQRRLMPWVAVERLFGSTIQATLPAGSSSPTFSYPSKKKQAGDGAAPPSSSTAASHLPPPLGASISGNGFTALPPTPTPHAGSYLAGSHVHLQLAKTTDNAVVIAIGASVMHLLLYAVDEPESRPSHLAHIVHEWQEALKSKGEELNCMVLLVHSDLVAASEAATRMAEEAQRVGCGHQGAASPTVIQDKVDAASAQLRKYYKELQELKFSNQQVSAYTPSETPMRILERLRLAVLACGGRLRHALQINAARRRQFPQDPSTKPIPPSDPSLPMSDAASSAVPPSLRSTGSPQRKASPAAAVAAAEPPSPMRRASLSATALGSPAAPPSNSNAQYFNVQAMWRVGYDVVVHYLQYGFVFDAREVLKTLFLEYYNNSDDYIFLRTPVATLERLGRVPNLFDARGHGGWAIGRSGYPKALEPGSELLEGLLLLASAEMTCSLLLGEPSAALRRYYAFVQVTQEKFEEWTASEAKAKRQMPLSLPSSTASSADQNQQRGQQQSAVAISSVTSSTYQQFFLLQCYLSGLRMWWPTWGLCRPRKPTSLCSTLVLSSVDPVAEKSQSNSAYERPQQGSAAAAPIQWPADAASAFLPLGLLLSESVASPDNGRKAALSSSQMDAEEDLSTAVVLADTHLLLPTSEYPASGAVAAASPLSPNPAAASITVRVPPMIQDSHAQVLPSLLSGCVSGPRYSMTNLPFVELGEMSPVGSSFDRVGSVLKRSELLSMDRQDSRTAAAPPPAAALPKRVGGKEISASNEDLYNAEQHSIIGGKEEENEGLTNFELNYLMAGSEDSAQASTRHLVELAVSIGLLAPSMEPKELLGAAEEIRDATECANGGLVREWQQRQRQLRDSGVEVASLLESARDSLEAVSHDLGYNLFSDPTSAPSDSNGREPKRIDGQEKPKCPAASADVATMSVNTTFSNIEELSSPAKALRLWRILVAMAALALHISDHRRREFHLYARLAMTFLSDRPDVTATIVADRLLPYVKKLGWRHLELFVRRLYVEAREQLIRQAGLFVGNAVGPNCAHDDVSSAAATNVMAHQRNGKAWKRVFPTSAAYALYRECMLVLISNGEEIPQDFVSPLSSAESAASGTQKHRGAVLTYAALGFTTEEDVVGPRGSHLFSHRSRAQWWCELLRVDALVMSAFHADEPPEYPLDHFTSPLMVQLDTEHLPSVSATSLNATPLDHPAMGALKASLDDVVRFSIVMMYAVNPLVGPDGESNLWVTSPRTSTPEPTRAVRLQLTLESRKDWADEDESTHVVHLHDCEDAVYDDVTHQLRAVFLFPVCHAGVYRIRRFRICNGKTWLAYYPQCGGSTGREKRERLDHGLHTMLSPGGGGVVAPHESTPALLIRTALDASFQPVTRVPVLRVPEPRSSVHLKLTLPEEAHCFADSVDYATLDIELEDPLSLPVSSGWAAGGQHSPGHLSKSADKNSDETGAAAAAAERGANDGTGEMAKCTCFYDSSPGGLLLPLSVAAASAEGRHTHGPGTAFSGEAIELASMHWKSPLMSGYRALPGNDGAGAAEGLTGYSDSSRSRSGPPFVAAVVLGTPNVYRQKGLLSHPGPAGAFTRVYSGASLSHIPMSYNPNVGAATAVGGLKRLSNSFSLRGHSSLHHHHSQGNHSPQCTTAAEAQLSSSIFSCSPLMSTFPKPAASGPPLANTVSSGHLYKSVFKPLRINAVTSNAEATATGGPVDAMRSFKSISIRNLLAADQQRSKSTHRHSQLQHNHPHSPPHLSTSPALSEPSAHDSMNAEESFGRRAGQSAYGSAAYLVGVGGAPAAGVSLSLHNAYPDSLQLVLKHPLNTESAGESKTATSTPPSKSSPAAASAAHTAVPIDLSIYLNSIPTPETQTQAPSALPTSEAKQAAEPTATLGPLLQAVSNSITTSSMDHLRESVIRLLPSSSVLQATTSSVSASPATAAGSENSKSGVALIQITRIRLRVPLLPLLVTPASTAQTKLAEASGAADPTSNTNIDEPAITSSSSVEAAKQARITFTCMRGREPSTTSLNVVIPFQLAIGFDYAFKHFQGRVYCMVRMKNLLKTTSLWMRGAVLSVLDPEPSYEIVRVCDVYRQLLTTEWKPQEEWSVLYELDLIASFHPAQPECPHQVQMKVFYSSWEKSFLTTPEEDRLVLLPEKSLSTEVTAESVELVHSEGRGAHFFPTPVRSTSPQRSSMESDNGKSGPPSIKADFGSDNSRRRRATMKAHTAAGERSRRRMPSLMMSGCSDHSEDITTPTATQAAHSSSSDSLSKMGGDVGTARRSSSEHSDSSASSSSISTSGAVHFNVATLRHLEATCNTVVGPVATFHSKHLCVFSIVMYAESPWTMRFGAATNYVARAPGTPLSGVLSTIGRESSSIQQRRPTAKPSSVTHQHLSDATFPGAYTGAVGFGAHQTNANGMATASADSLFGNAMVDPPADFVFVAGEPVRFCVRLQPLAQNWPEDASMEETFFIRLKYNPAEWMVIGKQRDRRTLSLMEEVTAYFNAVPLLPRANEDTQEFTRSPGAAEGEERSLHGSTMYEDDPDEEEEEDRAPPLGGHRERGSKGTARASRRLAGHAVRDEGILQTPTVEMFWERKKPPAGTPGTDSALTAACSNTYAQNTGGAPFPAAHEDAVMGEAVLIDVVQFRTWVRVRKRGH